MFDGGGVLFFAAAVVSFFYARVGAAIALAATVLQLPLYVYFIAPGPFRAVFRGDYSVPLRANFEWDRWSVAGILVLAATIYHCVRTLLVRRADGRGRPSLHFET
jgi:hypothetical protein